MTKEQLEEIEKLASESHKIRKQMIDKYVEYGVISKERGDKIKESMDKHFERMKEHNFTPFLHKIKEKLKIVIVKIINEENLGSEPYRGNTEYKWLIR